MSLQSDPRYFAQTDRQTDELTKRQSCSSPPPLVTVNPGWQAPSVAGPRRQRVRAGHAGHSAGSRHELSGSEEEGGGRGRERRRDHRLQPASWPSPVTSDSDSELSDGEGVPSSIKCVNSSSAPSILLFLLPLLLFLYHLFLLFLPFHLLLLFQLFLQIGEKQSTSASIGVHLKPAAGGCTSEEQKQTTHSFFLPPLPPPLSHWTVTLCSPMHSLSSLTPLGAQPLLPPS